MTSELQQAIEQGNLDAVVSALDNGADIEEADMHGYPGLPLRIACFNGHRAVIVELLRRGADIHALNHEGRGAPIRMAIRGQHLEVVNLLLEHGADIPPGMDLQTIAEKIARAQSAAASAPRYPAPKAAAHGHRSRNKEAAASRENPQEDVLALVEQDTSGWDKLTHID